MSDVSARSAKKIIVICGPTGSGKTGFAIDLARRINGEIVGADSMQIYRYMDIGTAKPTPDEQAAASHHMIDIVNPDEDFDAAMYARMAAQAIHRIDSRERTALVVGGTGFYIKALIHGLFEKRPTDSLIRKKLEERAESEGSAALHRHLQRVDSESAKRIHPNDTYRIIRALEVFEDTGKPFADFRRDHGFRKKRFAPLTIGLSWPRPELYERINRRVDVMMEQGFFEEVQALLKKGYSPELKSMQSLGYRHLSAVIRGESEMEEAVETLKRDHRRYAKRQLTWFGAQEAIHWLLPAQTRLALDLIRDFIQ